MENFWNRDSYIWIYFECSFKTSHFDWFGGSSVKSESLTWRWKLRINGISAQHRFVINDRSNRKSLSRSAIAIGEHSRAVFWASIAPAAMHGYGYASVLRNRIAVSFFCGCFLPVALAEACLPFVLCDKVFYAEMCLIANESVWPYSVSRLSMTTIMTMPSFPSFHVFARSRLWKCNNVHYLSRDLLFYWKLTRFFCTKDLLMSDVLHPDWKSESREINHPLPSRRELSKD